MADSQMLFQTCHEFPRRQICDICIKRMSDDHIHAKGREQVRAFIGSGQALDFAFAQHGSWMWEESNYNGRYTDRVCACRQFMDDFLVAAMDAIINANRQPAILQCNVGDGINMLHVDCRGTALLCPYKWIYEKKTFLG